MNVETFKVKNKAGEVLVGDLYTTDAKSDQVIVIIHGYSGKRKGDSEELAKMLLAEGHHCITFDCSGCGESEGNLTHKTISDWIDDTIAVTDWAKENEYSHFALCAVSAGATIALETALIIDAKRMLLRAPVSDYHQKKLIDIGEEGIKKWKETGYYTYTKSTSGVSFKISYELYEDYLNHVLYDKATSNTCPTLILHGDKDDDVPLEQSQKLAENMPHALLIVVAGANHMIYIDRDNSQLHRFVKDWFSEW